MQTDFWQERTLRKDKIDLIQINIGNLCNQTCTHCHVGASPHGKQNMDKETALKVLAKIKTLDIEHVEFTGGTPEMNENFTMFIKELSKAGKRVTVRTSLTVLKDPTFAHFIELYKTHKVKVIASLPSVFEDLTTAQRGKGVYDASIEMLQALNEQGYAKDKDLELDLVYNPVGTYLPPKQAELQTEYKKHLKEHFDIRFNKLITIVNMPIKRFKKDLQNQGKLEEYTQTLQSRFNEKTLENIMCRNIISVGYDGSVYDCDFNLALDMPIEGRRELKFYDIDFDTFKPKICFAKHCYACTVDQGSSCHGALVEDFNEQDNAKEYYGEVLQGSADLKTTACCTIDMIPKRVREVLPEIVEEIKDRYYGCGSPIPLELKGQSILDLGCGSGRDVYVHSKLVGEEGRVYGIDMTPEQIAVAKKYETAQAKRFGYQKANTHFIHDYIENIDKHFASQSLDIITSNCVINLLKDKKALLKKVHSILKEGGEMYFSDVYADRRLSEEVRTHKVLHGECLGGALYVNDFKEFAREAGFKEVREVSRKEIEITDDEVKALVGNTRFCSITYRLWKLEDFDSVCEDYGQIAIYKGGIEEAELEFELDNNHLFEKARAERVCKNTASMLLKSRFAKFFDIIGDTNTHYGEFTGCATVATEQKRLRESMESNLSSSCGC